MRTFLRRSPFSALLVFLFSVRALAQAPASAADEKDIRSIGTQIQDAWNKADARMLADLWLTDGDYISSTGRTARGRAEVEKAFSLDDQLRNVNGIMDRVFAPATVTSV